jgi:hypothetical protein
MSGSGTARKAQFGTHALTKHLQGSLFPSGMAHPKEGLPLFGWFCLFNAQPLEFRPLDAGYATPRGRNCFKLSTLAERLQLTECISLLAWYGDVGTRSSPAYWVPR